MSACEAVERDQAEVGGEDGGQGSRNVSGEAVGKAVERRRTVKERAVMYRVESFNLYRLVRRLTPGPPGANDIDECNDASLSLMHPPYA